jgi:hypothetical protein
MKITRIAGAALALAFAASLAAAQTTATDKPKDDKTKATTAKPPEKTQAADSNPDKAKGAPAGAPDEKAMMEAMAKAGAVGEQHKMLGAMAGTWDVHVKMWMKPGDPPQESTGTATRTAILGGRFLEEKFEGSMMGQPFSGQGMTGYDNVTKKYVSTWADSMGTGIMNMTGAMDKGSKSLTMRGTMVDPMTNKASAIKEKLTNNDADHQTFEMWGAGPDGKTYRMMEITYARKK